MDPEPIMLSRDGRTAVPLALSASAKGPGWLAAEHLRQIAHRELGCDIELGVVGDPGWPALAVCPPWQEMPEALGSALELSSDGKLAALETAPHGDQGFVATRLGRSESGQLILAADTEMGLRNALLTLSDRLYRDAGGNVVVDPFDGVHSPVFEARHIKTDAMNAGPFRFRLEYWDPTTVAGVNEFADWLASFRITDYDLLAFVRGWGATYASDRFPALVDPQHPNSAEEFYPQLLDRLHAWGLRAWASDVYIASGYTMEVGTCPEMLSPCADGSRLDAFRAGQGSFRDILHAPEAIACLSHPAASRFYSQIVADLLDHYPTLDGLDFHIGHTFPNKICRCPKCVGLTGNHEAVYRCFARVYETAIGRRPDIRLKTAVKMFGDATRRIVEHWEEFPQLEFFCWLRWAGNLLIERTDAPVTVGHEDGGGGLEANHDPAKTLDMIRDYFRDYEPWVQTYVQMTRDAKLPSISWEPVLQRELEHNFFLYSQLTWEPDLTWKELARRYVLRSERRLDDRLAEAYRLALEANAAVTSWGLAPNELGCAQRVIQTQGLLETAYVRDRIAALEEAVTSMGLEEEQYESPPVSFDLRRSLVKALSRLRAGEVLGQWH